MSHLPAYHPRAKLSSCCGQHFRQSCINCVIVDREQCPYCKDVDFHVFLDKKQTRKILALTVSCSAKAHGCSWTGELGGELGTHTDTQDGDYQFVDVPCPNSCGESLQRRHLESHLSDTCPKRPFTCEHCNVNSCKHYSECTKFPVLCPTSVRSSHSNEGG